VTVVLSPPLENFKTPFLNKAKSFFAQSYTSPKIQSSRAIHDIRLVIAEKGNSWQSPRFSQNDPLHGFYFAYSRAIKRSVEKLST